MVVPSIGRRPRCCSKSPTTASTRMPGYAAASSGAASTRTGSHTSKGTNRSSVPASARPSSSSRVFVDVPDPSSTRLVAPVRRAIDPASRSRISVSLRVG